MPEPIQAGRIQQSLAAILGVKGRWNVQVDDIMAPVVPLVDGTSSPWRPLREVRVSSEIGARGVGNNGIAALETAQISDTSLLTALVAHRAWVSNSDLTAAATGATMFSLYGVDAGTRALLTSFQGVAVPYTAAHREDPGRSPCILHVYFRAGALIPNLTFGQYRLPSAGASGGFQEVDLSPGVVIWPRGYTQSGVEGLAWQCGTPNQAFICGFQATEYLLEAR